MGKKNEKKQELTDEEFHLQRTQMLRDHGGTMDFYPNRYDVKQTVAAIREMAGTYSAGEQGSDELSSAGRINTIRGHGKLFFFDVESTGVSIQLVLNSGGAEIYGLAEMLKRGDIVGFRGCPGRSKSSEPSVFVTDLVLLAPCLRSIPSTKNELKDAETIYRKRHIDLLVNKESRERFVTRSRIVGYIRDFFNTRDFLEVETPTLHLIHGGAAALPFTTFHNDLKQTMYLRIAPELFLKRLVVGGLDRVFEIGKNFRNEGIDLTHNPEFTACEAYMAYADYEDWMRMTEELLGGLVEALKGTRRFAYSPTKREGAVQPVELDFTAPFARYDILEEINRNLGLALDGQTVETSMEELVAAAGAKGIEFEGPRTLNRVLDRLVGEFIEPKCTNPTFITGYPLVTSPLAKEDKKRARIAERFELFINGKEICNSYTELNIPAAQRERFEEQQAAKTAGDSEAMPIDEDYCNSIEYGLAPTGGWGLGIDRLVMYLTNAANIRDVILFPTMRPE